MATEHNEYDEQLPQMIELTVEEGLQMFDELAQETLGMSGEEFLRKWDAGEFEDPDQTAIMNMIFLIPFTGRPIVIPNE